MVVWKWEYHIADYYMVAKETHSQFAQISLFTFFSHKWRGYDSSNVLQYFFFLLHNALFKRKTRTLYKDAFQPVLIYLFNLSFMNFFPLFHFECFFSYFFILSNVRFLCRIGFVMTVHSQSNSFPLYADAKSKTKPYSNNKCWIRL